MPSEPINLVGSRFGRTRVLAYSHHELRPHADRVRRYHYWSCECDCGRPHTARSEELLRGSTKSCGCLRVDTARVMLTTHGLSGTPEFSVWSGMLQRCYSESHEAYANYGGRGIYVCDRWHDFSAFISDMGARPTSKHSVERLNNDDPYSPENCVWATRAQQALNTRRSARLTLRGETKTMKEWSELLGISYYVLRARRRRGWADDRTLTTPVGESK